MRFIAVLVTGFLASVVVAAELKPIKPIYRGKSLPAVKSRLVTITPPERLKRVLASNENILAEGVSGEYYQVVPAINSLLLTPVSDSIDLEGAIKTAAAKAVPDRFNKATAPQTIVAQSSVGDIRYAWFSKPVQLQTSIKSPSGLKQVFPTQLNVLKASGQTLVYNTEKGEVFEDNQPLITDLGRDGLNEVVVTKRTVGKSAYAVMLMPNLNKLIPVVDFPKDKNNFWSKAIAADDFDGDSYPEVAAIVAPEAISYFKLFEIQQGQVVEQDSAYGYLVPEKGEAVLTYDFNKDNRQDLFILRNDLQGINILTYARGFLERIVDQELRSRMVGSFVVAYKDDYPYRFSFLLNNGQLAMLMLEPPSKLK